MISPLSGSNKPTRHFINTVLPLPLVPMIRLHFPVSNTALTSLMTVLSPNPFFIFFTSIIEVLFSRVAAAAGYGSASRSLTGANDFVCRLSAFGGCISGRLQQERRKHIICKQDQHTTHHHRFCTRPSNFQCSTLYIITIKSRNA